MHCSSILPYAFILIQFCGLQFTKMAAEGQGWPRDFNCYDLYDTGYIGDIPHPTDCDHYLSCSVNIDGYAQATVRPCGNDLQYNMEKCACDWRNTATCYESGNPDHEEHRFRCAEAIIKTT